MVALRKLLVDDGPEGRPVAARRGRRPGATRGRAAAPPRRGGRRRSAIGHGVPGDGRRRRARDASIEGAAPTANLSEEGRTAPRGARKEEELGGQPDRHPLSRGMTRPGGHGEGLGSARLGSARLGSARLGSARLGSARLGSARLGSARLGSARLGSARLGSARLGSARLGSARLGSARLYYSTARPNPRQNAGIDRPPNAACQGDAPHPLSADPVRRRIARTLHRLLTVNEVHLFTPAGRADVLLFSGRFSRSRTRPSAARPGAAGTAAHSARSAGGPRGNLLNAFALLFPVA